VTALSQGAASALWLEIWRPIPSCPGYEASNFGRIRSIKPGRKARIKTPRAALNGYLAFTNYQAGGRKPKDVHVAVAEAFLGPRPPRMYVLHMDGDKTNNRIVNLRYGTPSENNYDAVRHGTHTNAAKTHCKRGHEFTPENTYISIRDRRHCRACNVINSRESKYRTGVRKRPTKPIGRSVQQIGDVA
jgi:hypothetical protein